jgi:GT2 family glycosyltransferase
VSAFVGTAYALDRELFLRIGGYRGVLKHSGEERDFCSRLYARGYCVRLGTAPAVYHYASPIRDAWRARMLERRNDICNACWNVPFPQLLYHLPGTVLSGLRYGVSHGCLGATLAGYRRAPGICLRHWNERAPVRAGIYRLLRKLNRQQLLPLEEIEPLLAPV